MQETYKPTSNLKMAGIFAAVLAVLAAGLVVGAKYDLVIDKALLPLWQQAQADHAAGQPSLWYWWAILTESIAGVWPPYAALVLLGWTFCVSCRTAAPKYKIMRLLLGTVLCVGGSVAAVFTTFNYLAKRGTLLIAPWIGIAGGILVGVLVVLWATVVNISTGQLRRWRTLALFSVGVMLGQQLLTRIVKSICQRTRFDDMLALGDFSGFTPWTQLPGQGGSSFPSGHTASAAVLLILLVACRLFDSCKGDEPAFLALGYGCTGAVAFGRMLIGRHYLSDTLMAALIVTLLVMVVWFVPPLARSAIAAGGQQPGDDTPIRPMWSIGLQPLFNALQQLTKPASRQPAAEQAAAEQPAEQLAEQPAQPQTDPQAKKVWRRPE